MNATESPLAVSYADVAAAAERLAGYAHRTPVMTSRTVDARTGATVFFKCENFQRIGAFKFRGAFNALSRLPDEQKRRGVLTYSSGNHAQAVAHAGRTARREGRDRDAAGRAAGQARRDARLRRGDHHVRQAPRTNARNSPRASPPNAGSRSSRRTITPT